MLSVNNSPNKGIRTETLRNHLVHGCYIWQVVTGISELDKTNGDISVRCEFTLQTRMPFSRRRTIRVTHRSQKHLQIGRKLIYFHLTLI